MLSPLSLIPGIGPVLDFARSTLGRLVIVAAVSFGGGVTLTAKHYRAQIASAEAAHKAAVAAESQRRVEAIAAAQRDAEAAADALAALTADNGRLEQEIAHASRRNDARPCLPADAGLRLNKIGRAGQRAGRR